MARYISKRIEIDAIVWNGGDYSHVERFCGRNWSRADAADAQWLGLDDGEKLVVWNTLESQWLCVPKGHYIIRGIKGELYPCEKSIFERKYEPAAPPTKEGR